VKSKPRVLVVDDEPAIRALVAKIVERAGHPVDSARDGAEAIEKLEAQQYAVVVLDLMMPIVDGYALIEHLKRRGGPRPAIIVVSAGDSAALRQLDGSVVHSIIRKPFDIDVLGDLISAAAQSSLQTDVARDEEDDEPGAASGGSVVRFPGC
jgi:CheY-like chemotaxis protein